MHTSQFDKTSVVFTDDYIISMKSVQNKHENNLQRTDFHICQGKSPVCDSTNILVHVHLSENAIEPAELPTLLKVTWQLLKANDGVLSSIRMLIC